MAEDEQPDAGEHRARAHGGTDREVSGAGASHGPIAPIANVLSATLDRAASLIAVAVIVIASIAIAGWALHEPILTSLAPGFVSMKLNAAIGLLACALSLLCHTTRWRTHSLVRSTGRACAAFAIAVGAVTGLQDVVHSDFGIDQLLTTAAHDLTGTRSPGRMAPGTAVALALTGAALLLQTARDRQLRSRAEILAVAGMLLAFLTVIGYAFGVRALVGVPSSTQMALMTATAFILLSLGLLMSNPDSRIIARLVSQDVGGVLSRRMLPLVLCLPILLGWLRLQGQRHGFYDLEFGLGVMVALSMLLLATVVYWTADTVGRTDIERSRMSAALQRANEVLENRVEDRTRDLVRAVELLRIEVDQRISADQQAQASSQRLIAVAETAHDGIIALTPAGAIEYANNAAERMFGYPGRTLGSTRIQALFAARYSDWCEGVLRQSMDAERNGGHGTLAEVVARHHDGHEFPVEVSLGRWTVGDQISFTLIIRDIRERKALEARVQVSDRMASIGALAAGVAHEINNPLTYILGNVHLIDKRIEAAQGGDQLSPKVRDEFAQARDMLNDIKLGGFQIRNIVHNLRTLTRADTDRRELINLREVADAAVNIAWHEIRHRAGLDKQYSDVPPVLGNGSRLGQVVLNLLVNAAHSIPEGHANDNVIRLVIRPHLTEQVAIEVSDSGSGIAPEILDRIFDPFFTTKAIGEGTGLGLAISRSIVTDMDGCLEVETMVGRGTTFRVVLPVTTPPTTTTTTTTTTISPAPEPDLRRGRILVIDDEPLVAASLQRTLQVQHEVVTCQSGPEALALLVRDSSFDLILCDLMMPTMTGIELHARLAAAVPHLVPRMVFITGGAFTATAREFSERTANPVLEKAMDPGDLLTRVSALIPR